jgi:sterol desaturase/sphingolipid hydroxylase (fatty acid hydroxylase superfamily)
MSATVYLGLTCASSLSRWLFGGRFNKAWVPIFVYQTNRYVWLSKNIAFGLSEVSLKNTALTIPMLFIVYDFFYSLFHRALHHRST